MCSSSAPARADAAFSVHRVLLVSLGLEFPPELPKSPAAARLMEGVRAGAVVRLLVCAAGAGQASPPN